jgi:two-component system response regulator AlgR
MAPRIFIVDDEAPARARLATLLSDIAAEFPYELAGEAENGVTALTAIPAARPDIVLLDIQMPGMSGIELAGHLGGLEHAPAVIFITAFDSFALKAFEVHAIDYLLKPVRAARLADALRRAMALAGPKPQAEAIAATAADLGVRRQHFAVQERGRLTLVPLAEVVYLKAELKYVTLRTRARDYVIEESLLSLEQELGERFVRVHRNTLVARSAIVGVERGVPDASDPDKGQESWQVVLAGIDERLQISRRQWPVIKALLNRGA